MKEIQVNRGMVVLLDDEDYDLVSQYTWTASRPGSKGTWYASSYRGEKRPHRKAVFLHRFLLGVTDSKIFVDHKNHNGLDNRRENIRVATQSQNNANKTIGTGRFKGVYPVNQKNGRWAAQYKVNGKAVHLGTYDSQEEAARAHDVAVKLLHGEFAVLNFPEVANG